MTRTLIADLNSHLNEEVVVKGWVERIRELSSVTFLILRDRTGRVQAAAEPGLVSRLKLSTESVVELRGRVKPEPRSKMGFEVAVSTIGVLSAAGPLPININGPTLNVPLELVLDNRVLTLRHATINPIFRIQAALAQGFQSFLIREGFTQVFTPKIVASGTEGGTELFSVQYFDEKAYLCQSPQFYKQMLVGAGFERVFEVGHVYRAEKHATSRHLNEYVSLDLEMGFIENEHDVMDLENRLLRFMFEYVGERCEGELKSLDVVLPVVPVIPKVPLLEALELLEREFGKTHEGRDLDPEGERLLSKYVYDTTGSEFVFVTDYPWEKRPMYTMPKGRDATRSFDLLFRGLEITTGGQRIHSYDLLVENMLRKGLEPGQFSSYLNAFALGMPPHGGLAIGLERLTAQIAGLINVREASLFPRDRHRLTP
ncbi:MAG TPA: aspartate--tRNA(Asn) ligase [Firmicutes bacterium]|nr:aspartate--tRNA(Asn) ligase [Bacillota bacterium]HHT42666.1 aspartate--tRNA(Asn) ligase [Bacillota bacterium]